jgi:hypothetical protein
MMNPGGRGDDAPRGRDRTLRFGVMTVRGRPAYVFSDPREGLAVLASGREPRGFTSSFLAGGTTYTCLGRDSVRVVNWRGRVDGSLTDQQCRLRRGGDTLAP